MSSQKQNSNQTLKQTQVNATNKKKAQPPEGINKPDRTE
jgi:hypothetical protein